MRRDSRKNSPLLRGCWTTGAASQTAPDQSHDDTRSGPPLDRKSTRLNSSHVRISYAVFCLKKKNNQWTQFESFPKFMSGVKDVRQLDDTHTHWRAEVWGKETEWDAELTYQIPDRIIAWRSTSGDAPNAGAVSFEPVPGDRTRVNLMMEYEPQGVTEKFVFFF